MKMYKLTPIDGRKSFYGKAKVCVADDGTETLYSYDTPVMKRTTNGEFIRIWEGYTPTTMCHINAFVAMFGISGSKKWWATLPLEEDSDGSGGAWLTPAESLKTMYARRAMND